jgi:prevent-host-death family protein
MKDIIISVADFKTHLSRFLSESRKTGNRIIIMNRKKPVATLLPINETMATTAPGNGGLASLAGAWTDFEEIAEDVMKQYNARKTGKFREISI